MNNKWIQHQWEGAQLGDQRLTKRAIKIGMACLNKPSGTLPEKCGSWANTKAAYRFFDSDKVSHENLQEQHTKNVIELAKQAGETVLFIQDGSEILYNSHPCTQGLGPTADSLGQGILFHTALAVVYKKNEEPIVIGLAKQITWIRPKNKTPKTRANRESKVWLDILKSIGSPPPNQQWISVGDRGNDIYDYILGAEELGWDYLLRSCQDRQIFVNGEKERLFSWIRSINPAGEYKLNLRKRENKPARTATLKVSWGQALMPPPHKEKGKRLKVTYIRVYDPEDKELEWLLATSLEVESLEEALRIIQMYEKRWIIEEYHKCLKTGCRIEEAQLKEGKRLLALLGMLGIIATQLLQLRDISRQNGEIAAEGIVTEEQIKVVKNIYHLEGPIQMKEVWRRIAMMGGFLGRKSDGEPGWQTIWKGWLRIQDIVNGMAISKEIYG